MANSDHHLCLVDADCNLHKQQESKEDHSSNGLDSPSIDHPFILSMEDEANLARYKWKVGSKIGVYSRGKQQWFEGIIQHIYESVITTEEWLIVKYDHKTKQIQRFSKYIEPLPIICPLQDIYYHYIFPTTHSIKYNHDVTINKCKLSLNNSGYLQMESTDNITFVDCIIDLTGYNMNDYGITRRDGDILRFVDCDYDCPSILFYIFIFLYFYCCSIWIICCFCCIQSEEKYSFVHKYHEKNEP